VYSQNEKEEGNTTLEQFGGEGGVYISFLLLEEKGKRGGTSPGGEEGGGVGGKKEGKLLIVSAGRGGLSCPSISESQ